MDKTDIGSVLERSSKSPDLKMGINSGFHVSAKVFDDVELLTAEMVIGELSIKTLTIILSCLGALNCLMAGL